MAAGGAQCARATQRGSAAAAGPGGGERGGGGAGARGEAAARGRLGAAGGAGRGESGEGGARARVARQLQTRGARGVTGRAPVRVYVTASRAAEGGGGGGSAPPSPQGSTRAGVRGPLGGSCVSTAPRSRQRRAVPAVHAAAQPELTLRLSQN